MIIGLEGGLGTGKTLGAVRYLYKDYHNGKKIMSNIWLNDKYIKHDKLDILQIMSNPDLSNCSILIDEITVFMDCRSSMSKMNKLLSYFILQTRKRDVTLYFTTQNFDMTDLRLMNHTDIIVLCESIKYRKDFKRYTIIDLRDSRKPNILRFNMKISLYYDMYDTKQVILPPI